MYYCCSSDLRSFSGLVKLGALLAARACALLSRSIFVRHHLRGELDQERSKPATFVRSFVAMGGNINLDILISWKSSHSLSVPEESPETRGKILNFFSRTLSHAHTVSSSQSART